jgi:hypothetical protein
MQKVVKANDRSMGDVILGRINRIDERVAPNRRLLLISYG